MNNKCIYCQNQCVACCPKVSKALIGPAYTYSEIYPVRHRIYWITHKPDWIK